MTGLKLAFGFLVLCSGVGVLVCGIDVLARQERPTRRVAFVAGGSDAYWQLAAQGAQAAARDKGIDLHVELPSRDGDAQQQASIIARLQEQSWDGVAVCPSEASQTAAWVQCFGRASKLLTFLTDVPKVGQHFSLSMGDMAAGRQCVHALDNLPSDGEILLLLPRIKTAAIKDRFLGLREALKTMPCGAGATMLSRLRVVSFPPDHANGPTVAMAAALHEALSTHPRTMYVVSLLESGAGELVDVIENLNMSDRVRLVSFDQSDSAMAAVEAGRLHAVVAEDPYAMGYAAVCWTAHLCRCDAMGLPAAGMGQANVPAEVVRQDNVAQFRGHLIPPHALPQS